MLLNEYIFFPSYILKFSNIFLSAKYGIENYLANSSSKSEKYIYFSF